MSITASVSPGSSCSALVKNTLEALAEMPAKAAAKAPLPPGDPVDTCVVVPPERW